MSYLARLRGKGPKGATQAPDKTDKSPFVSSVGSPSDHLSAKRAEIRRLLTELGCGPEHPDFEVALAVAFADPAGALGCLRLSVAVERGAR